MKLPSIDPQQFKALRGMIDYWTEIDHRDDKKEVTRIMNAELQSLHHVMPAINILRAVAYYVNNYQKEEKKNG